MPASGKNGSGTPSQYDNTINPFAGAMSFMNHFSLATEIFTGGSLRVPAQTRGRLSAVGGAASLGKVAVNIPDK